MKRLALLISVTTTFFLMQSNSLAGTLGGSMTVNTSVVEEAGITATSEGDLVTTTTTAAGGTTGRTSGGTTSILTEEQAASAPVVVTVDTATLYETKQFDQVTETYSPQIFQENNYIKSKCDGKTSSTVRVSVAW